MSSAKSVTAVFGEDQNVVVTIAGLGHGDVTDGAEGALACDETNPGTCTETYDYGDDITLTASADASYRFTGWSGTNAGSCTTSTCTFTDISAAKAVTATFVPSWEIVVTINGSGFGHVTDDADLSCTTPMIGTCTGSYDENDDIELQAQSSPGSTFTGWSGDDAPGNCEDTICTFTDITEAKAVTATFVIDTFNVVVTVSGGNGDVTDGAEGALACDETNGPCTETYDYGDDITLTASADAGYRFMGWSGTNAGSCSVSTCTFSSITAAKAVTATFVVERDVVVTIAGTGEGGVTDGAAGLLDCDDMDLGPCTESYGASTNVTLTATAAAGSTFTGWSGADVGDCLGSTCTFTPIATAKAVTATFTDLIALYITYSGDGSGTVSDGTESYSDGEVTYWAAGSSVTLSQVSSDDFLGWRVAIAGIPDLTQCSDATSDCILTINQDTLVGVEFDAASSGGGGGGGTLAPVSTVAPVVSGYTAPGASLTSTYGTWDYANTYAYQWYRCTSASSVTRVTAPSNCTKITGGTSASYVITALDSGSWLRVQVSATGSGGTTDILSVSSAKVGPKPASVKAKPPRVVGATVAGQILTAKRGKWSNAPTTYSYQWYSCTKAGLKNPKSVPVVCTALTGASSKTYTVMAADKGSFLRVYVTATGATGQGFRMSRTTGVIPN